MREGKGPVLASGIIGGGFMGRAHAVAVRRSRGTVLAASSSTPERSETAAAWVGAQRSWSTPMELIHDPAVDIVHICSPNSTHAVYALAALEAGKHVVCEKPLAVDPKTAYRLADAATAAGVVAAVPYVYRFHAMAREARERVRSGAIGDIRHLQGTYLQDWFSTQDEQNWRLDPATGGPSRAFADIGSHLADLTEFISGHRVTRLGARTKRAFGTRGLSTVQTEDIAAVLFETDLGAVGTMLVSQVAPGRKNALSVEISGAKETLRFDQEQPDNLWIGRRTESAVVARDPARISSEAARMSELPPGHPTGYHDAFAAFMSDVHTAVRGARPQGLPDFDDGARSVAITHAVLCSAASGGWVDVTSEPPAASTRPPA